MLRVDQIASQESIETKYFLTRHTHSTHRLDALLIMVVVGSAGKWLRSSSEPKCGLYSA